MSKEMIRIANCSGFYGDKLSIAKEMVEGGPIDVLTGDYLAELTMTILYNQKIIDYHPNDSRGFINTAVMAMSGKKPEEAILALSPHSEKFSGDFTVQYLLGTAYYQIKDYKKSKEYLSLSILIRSNSKSGFSETFFETYSSIKLCSNPF